MSVFVDTSAFLAVLDADDSNHPAAKRIWRRLLQADEELICSSYVLVETIAIVQHRLGLEAVRAFHDGIYGLLEIVWVRATEHESGVKAALSASRRKLGLVDCVSFEIMRRLKIRKAFCFDKHFSEQGFLLA